MGRSVSRAGGNVSSRLGRGGETGVLAVKVVRGSSKVRKVVVEVSSVLR
jgi:hypothetical protein